MKYQFELLRKLINEKYKIHIYIYLIFFVLIFLTIRDNYLSKSINTYYILLGIPIVENISILELSWFIFQWTILLYFGYLFFRFEHDNSLEFIILRKPLKKLMIKKFTIFSGLIIIIRTIILFLLLFLCSIKINILLVFLNIFIYIIILFISLIFYVFFEKN